MPTGYTAAIADGISFEDFAMQCARAFGALVLMRDDPSDKPIPERFEPSAYSAVREKEARDELARLRALTPKQVRAEAAAQYDRAEALRLSVIEKQRALKQKYEAMLLAVQAWKPPTPDHCGLQDFMSNQISESIRFDCNEKFYAEPPPRLTPEAWHAAAIEKASRDVAYHAKSYAEEVERTDQRNAWIAALRESLKQGEAAKP